MIKFIKDGAKYDVELNDKNYGVLEFDSERQNWVLWYADTSEGVDYFESLKETKDEIEFELENA